MAVLAIAVLREYGRDLVKRMVIGDLALEKPIAVD